MIQIDLSITLTQAQINAWNTIKPVLKPYLAKIMRVYRNCPDTQKDELRQHNPILDAVLDMLGE